VDKGFFKGLDSVMREAGFLAGAILCAGLGFQSAADRWTVWPRGSGAG